jgi:hypothetical protein
VLFVCFCCCGAHHGSRRSPRVCTFICVLSCSIGKRVSFLEYILFLVVFFFCIMAGYGVLGVLFFRSALWLLGVPFCFVVRSTSTSYSFFLGIFLLPVQKTKAVFFRVRYHNKWLTKLLKLINPSSRIPDFSHFAGGAADWSSSGVCERKHVMMKSKSRFPQSVKRPPCRPRPLHLLLYGGERASATSSCSAS